MIWVVRAALAVAAARILWRMWRGMREDELAPREDMVEYVAHRKKLYGKGE